MEHREADKTAIEERRRAMEVNKEEAARCRDIGAAALRNGQHARAVRFLEKSLKLYPLPGVTALLGQARRKAGGGEAAGGPSANGGASAGGASDRTADGASSSSSSSTSSGRRPMGQSPSSGGGAAPSVAGEHNGRSYTPAQAAVVESVLRSKEGGRGAHYRVLGIESTATDADIKKAYRKLALRLHPDKNSAPKADEAFKAVGLAYATLSDGQKRRIYDVSGDEDPDSRGGGMRRGGAHFNGQEVSPEDIFNMFFGGGMPGGMHAGGGNGFRVYTTGFGPGMGFGMHPGMGRQQRGRGQGNRQQQQQADAGPLSNIAQFIPLLMILLLSFLNSPGDTGTGGNRYFSLTPVSPHTNQLGTKLSKVKDIPYYVSDTFLRTVARDKYQLSQVERMVESSYEQYLRKECDNQRRYKRKLEDLSRKARATEKRAELARRASNFEMPRCQEWADLFGGSTGTTGGGAAAQQQRRQQQANHGEL